MGRDQVLWQLFNGFVWGMYDLKTDFFFLLHKGIPLYMFLNRFLIKFLSLEKF